MPNIPNFFLFILVFSACLAAPAQAAKYKIHWLLGHQNLDYFEEAAENFKKAVEAGSHGDIEVEIMTTQARKLDQQRSSQEIAAAVAKGEVEMGHSFTDIMGRTDPRLWAFDAPYLFRGYRHLEGVFEGPVGSELLEGLRAHQMVGLSFTYSGGASGIAAREREIRGPADMKGLKVGAYSDAVNEAWLKTLGATPVAIGHGQEDGLPAMASSGALDAVVITWRNFERAALDLSFKYVAMMDSSYLVSVTYVNEKFFDGLPRKYQTLLREASREAGRIERAKTIELNESAKRAMAGKGVRQIYLTEEGRKSFTEAFQPAYENSIEGLLGKDLVERIKNTQDSRIHPSIPGDLTSSHWARYGP